MRLVIPCFTSVSRYAITRFFRPLRVNRLFEEDSQEKEFGFILDYEGLLGELDKALTTYSAFAGFDPEDVAGALVDVHEEIKKLPQLHEQLWDLFKEVRNKKDMEQFEQLLADEARRHDFYERLHSTVVFIFQCRQTRFTRFSMIGRFRVSSEIGSSSPS
jgi:type I site-specific restriction-modification system R (restriction) subunit